MWGQPVRLVPGPVLPYNRSVKLRLTLTLVSLAAMATTASAQRRPVAPKVERACGVTAIPLSVGNSWTYEPTPPPPDRALSEAQIKNTPVQPKQMIIKVTGIETKEGVTTVSLSEDLDGKVHNTTITCRAGGAELRVAPDSFWFSGEAGAVHGIELSEVQRKGQTLLLTAGKLNPNNLEWHDDFSAKWKHVPTAKARPTMRTGTIDVLRRFVLQVAEPVTTKAGSWKAPTKLGLEINMKLTIEPAPAQPLKDQPLLVNFLWIADGVGPVQTLNSFGQQFQLAAYTVQ